MGTFVELQPRTAASDIGSGIRISVGERLGLRIMLAGPALSALGGGTAGSSYRVLLDRDPAMPRLRIIKDKAGKFELKKTALSKVWAYIAVGRQVGVPDVRLRSLPAKWEALDGKDGIEVDLPSQFAARGQVQPVGRPSTSTGPRPAPVTLAGSRTKERV